MDLRISEKNALVMGGSRGIGRAIAERLAREGSSVGIVARTRPALDEAVAAIRENGGTAHGFVADISDHGGYDALLAEFEDNLGSVDIVVYSPPTPGTGPLLPQDESGLMQTYNDLVVCFFKLAQLVVPKMKENQWGRFVTIGSGSVKSPRVGQAGVGFHYGVGNVNRLAAGRLSKQLAYEVAGFGITMNSIGVGTFKTETFDNHWGKVAKEFGVSLDEMSKMQVDAIPAGRFGTLEDVADLAAYLASDLSGYTTGETILCDGGKFVTAL